MKKSIFMCLAVCLMFVSVAVSQQKFSTSGNYDGIKTDAQGESGGIAVYLTQSDSQTYALVTTAAGVLLPPVLVDVKVTGKDLRTIEFTLPDANGDRKFTGTISAAALTLKESTTRSVLKRVCGNTYSKISVGSGGDYGGLEVYLTESDGQNYALVTVAEGVLMKPVLVEAKVTGKNYDHLEFTLPGDNGGRKFTGIKGKTGLTLTESGTRSVLNSKCYK